MFSATFGRLKFLVRKYIRFWHQQAKDCSCGLLLLLSFLSSFMSCVGLSLLGLFWFCFVCFLSKGHIHCLHPTRHSAVRLLCIFSWIAITVDCNHSELQWSEHRKDAFKHKGPRSWWQVYTRGLGCWLIGWSCQNKFALLVFKFKFQPGAPRRKSCFTSRAPRASHSLAPI